MSDPVLVSIVTPILDGARYLDGCIASVLGQDHAQIEHVFVDGGSTDGTLQMLSRYRQKHPDKVRVLSAPHTGPGEAWGKGLKAARGEIFGCLGVDDFYMPGAIRSVVDFFEGNPDACFVHGECEIIDDRGEVIGHHRVGDFDLEEFVNTARHIATPSAFYKRVVLERVGWLDPTGDDFDLMIRIAREFDIRVMPKVLSRLRVRAGSAFNPTDFRRRVAAREQTFRVSRRYGGRRWSPIARRYYAALVFYRLHLEVMYPWAQALYRTFARVSRG